MHSCGRWPFLAWPQNWPNARAQPPLPTLKFSSWYLLVLHGLLSCPHYFLHIIETFIRYFIACAATRAVGTPDGACRRVLLRQTDILIPQLFVYGHFCKKFDYRTFCCRRPFAYFDYLFISNFDGSNIHNAIAHAIFYVLNLKHSSRAIRGYPGVFVVRTSSSYING